MTDSEILNVIATNSIVVTYFSYPECSVCRVLRPKVEELVHSTQGAKFLYINTKEYPMTAGQNMVFAVPTIIIFAGGREAKRWGRNLSVSEVEQELFRLMERPIG